MHVFECDRCHVQEEPQCQDDVLPDDWQRVSIEAGSPGTEPLRPYVIRTVHLCGSCTGFLANFLAGLLVEGLVKHD